MLDSIHLVIFIR